VVFADGRSTAHPDGRSCTDSACKRRSGGAAVVDVVAELPIVVEASGADDLELPPQPATARTAVDTASSAAAARALPVEPTVTSLLAIAVPALSAATTPGRR
jgi:hypothetical protein